MLFFVYRIENHAKSDISKPLFIDSFYTTFVINGDINSPTVDQTKNALGMRAFFIVEPGAVIIQRS